MLYNIGMAYLKYPNIFNEIGHYVMLALGFYFS